MPVAAPPANTPVVDAFAQQLGVLLGKFKITTVVVVAQDPKTGQQKLFAPSPGAIQATRALAAEKYNLVAPENIVSESDDSSTTGWPDT